MPEIGQTISHYKIMEKIGQGGMGEVYLADDTTLDRKVALKFLPEAFTRDPERMARFEREAKLLASLNHPNIAGIYGLEKADGNRFLAMEYVEGETLQARLSKGALPLEDALALCRQIAEGLEAAHEKGVIHRDLKPANVMITADEKVKILDFGLAKALSDDSQSIDSSQSPTLTEAMTRPGVILGTAAYMSPEQAKGKSVDKRADIWAFGCILYECLTGKKAFEGETVTETLAAVLKGEPEWNALPSLTPENIRFVLRQCLEKERGGRLRCAVDAQILIEKIRNVGDVIMEPKKSPKWPAWSVAAILALTLIFFVWAPWRAEISLPEPIQFQIPYPDQISLGQIGFFALSPDGRHLAFSAVDPDNVYRLWLHDLNSLESQQLLGTESEREIHSFWSPDSRYIAFGISGALKKLDIFGGPPVKICDFSGTMVGGSWNQNDIIVFSDYNVSNGIVQVSADGGNPSQVTKPNPDRQENNHIIPQFLPDGRHFLYYCNSNIIENSGVYIGSLDVGPEEQNIKPLMESAWAAVYVPSENSTPGQLLFPREQTLMAQPFDYKRQNFVGPSISITENIGYYLNWGFFSASWNGILIFRSSGATPSQLTWFDRDGNILDKFGNKGLFGGISLSPDGQQAAISLYSTEQSNPSPDIYLHNFLKGTDTRFTFGKNWALNPIWSPDGSLIVFGVSSENGFNLYQKPSNGIKNEELVLKSNHVNSPTGWSKDGRYLLYTVRDLRTKDDLWLHQMSKGDDDKPLLNSQYNESYGCFSPNMRWIAYVSDENGIDEVFVGKISQSPDGKIPSIEGKWQISREGGSEPRWRRDSKELYFRNSDGGVMAVEVASDEVFQTLKPKLLFQPPSGISILDSITLISSWDVTSDGNHFLIPTPSTENSPTPFTSIINWNSYLDR